MSSDLRLATNWPVSRVRNCLRRKDRNGLVQFLRERHDERFFRPIKHLKNASGNIQGYGFAMMALCALLVETIQSYRDGLPTTFPPELARFRNMPRVPPRYRIPSSLRVNGKKAFERFFRAHRQQFSGLRGGQFYKNIRNGLLHQGQTKSKWTLSKWGQDVCDAKEKIIYRDKFAEQLESAFEGYLAKLRERRWNHRQWINAARKIWWLIRLSL
jgi:hypothetical protein